MNRSPAHRHPADRSVVERSAGAPGAPPDLIVTGGASDADVAALVLALRALARLGAARAPRAAAWSRPDPFGVAAAWPRRRGRLPGVAGG